MVSLLRLCFITEMCSLTCLSLTTRSPLCLLTSTAAVTDAKLSALAAANQIHTLRWDLCRSQPAVPFLGRVGMPQSVILLKTNKISINIVWAWGSPALYFIYRRKGYNRRKDVYFLWQFLLVEAALHTERLTPLRQSVLSESARVFHYEQGTPGTEKQKHLKSAFICRFLVVSTQSL